MKKLMKVSHNFKILFQFLLLFFPIATLAVWIFIDKLPMYMIESNLGLGSNIAQHFLFTPLSKSLGFLISLLSTGVIMYGILQFITLFKNYEKGNVFSIQNVSYYRKIGYTLFYYVVANLISRPFMSLALTFQNPPHHKMISISFGSNDLFIMITGGLVLLVSWVMQEAYKISEENAQTI